MSFTPADHVTEREVGPWRDCTFASMLEVLRFGFPDGEAIPPTVAEKEAYRAAAGLPDDHLGANLPTAIAAAELRYDLAGGYVLTSDWMVVRAAMLHGDLLVVTGSMAHVPSHLRRYDPSFDGAHAVAARGFVWCDPLAPKGLYGGELVGSATWQAFFTGLAGAQAFITRAGGLTKKMSGDFVIYNDLVASRKSGQPQASTPFFNDWQMTDRRGAFGLAPGRVEILGYRGQAYAVQVKTKQGWSDGIERVTLVFVDRDQITKVVDAPIPIPPPDGTPYSQADLDRAAADAAQRESDEWEAWVATHP